MKWALNKLERRRNEHYTIWVVDCQRVQCPHTHNFIPKLYKETLYKESLYKYQGVHAQESNPETLR